LAAYGDVDDATSCKIKGYNERQRPPRGKWLAVYGRYLAVYGDGLYSQRNTK
jgi:hypothetical protein